MRQERRQIGAACQAVKDAKHVGAVLSRRKGEHEGEHEEDINRGDDLGLYGHAVRVQLLRRPTTDHAYCQPNPNSHSDPGANSDPNSDANTDTHSDSGANTDSNPNSGSYTYTYTDSNPDAGSRSHSAAGNKRHAESYHAARSGSLDDVTELDAHQSGTRNCAEHRQRPLRRWIRQLPTGPSRMPDGSWIGHDLESFYRFIQHDPGSFRRLL